MRYGIKILGTVGVIAISIDGPQEGDWISQADVDAHDGHGECFGSPDPADALAFDSQGEAVEFWRKPSTVRPLRCDGLPNRPLTVFTVEISELPDAPA